MAIRLYVVHLPSPTQTAWEIALAEAATRAGWDVFSLLADEEPAFRDGVDALVQGADVNLIFDRTLEAVIVAGTPQSAVDTLMQIHDRDQRAALNAVAVWYAQASEAVARGARVLDAAAATLVLPGLGEVTRAAGRPVEKTGLGDSLALYETLPPAIGATALWAMDVFTWAGGQEPGFADLTGKRRVIQYGPFIVLSSGTWAAEIVFELTIDRAFAQLRFDWGDGTDVTETSRRLSTAGVYAVTLVKSWDRPTTTQLRIWLERSMFDGFLRIRSTRITRVQ